MSTDIPNGFIKNQPLTTPPHALDSTLVDDPVALVDDPVALVGSQTVIVEAMQLKAKILVPSNRIKITR